MIMILIKHDNNNDHIRAQVTPPRPWTTSSWPPPRIPLGDHPCIIYIYIYIYVYTYICIYIYIYIILGTIQIILARPLRKG